MTPKILVINDSSLFRGFLHSQLSEYGFEVVEAMNGLDGSAKIRQVIPDLIIMDYTLSRRMAVEVLTLMKNSMDTSHIPIVMTAASLEKKQFLEIARLGVKKILTKPIQIDALLEAVTECLGISLERDDTPCLVDSHLNDKILFVEIAKGFNREKINLLRYKMAELLRLYRVQDPRILILLTNMDFRKEDQVKLENLLRYVVDFIKIPQACCLLTTNTDIKEYLAPRKISVVSTLEEAMDNLLGIKGIESLTAEQENVQKRFFSVSHDPHKESFQLNFRKENALIQPPSFQKKIHVAAVDDDMVVREVIKNSFRGVNGIVKGFPSGKDFFLALDADEKFDIIFLDLIMPGMNGFSVLQTLRSRGINIPVIVFTALSHKEAVIKVRNFGVGSYMIKPIKPAGILAKTVELLGTDF